MPVRAPCQCCRAKCPCHGSSPSSCKPPPEPAPPSLPGSARSLQTKTRCAAPPAPVSAAAQRAASAHAPATSSTAALSAPRAARKPATTAQWPAGSAQTKSAPSRTPSMASPRRECSAVRAVADGEGGPCLHGMASGCECGGASTRCNVHCWGGHGGGAGRLRTFDPAERAPPRLHAPRRSTSYLTYSYPTCTRRRRLFSLR